MEVEVFWGLSAPLPPDTSTRCGTSLRLDPVDRQKLLLAAYAAQVYRKGVRGIKFGGASAARQMCFEALPSCSDAAGGQRVVKGATVYRCPCLVHSAPERGLSTGKEL